jgi:hypothetical protein
MKDNDSIIIISFVCTIIFSFFILILSNNKDNIIIKECETNGYYSVNNKKIIVCQVTTTDNLKH